jgi:hypothetical protein
MADEVKDSQNQQKNMKQPDAQVVLTAKEFLELMKGQNESLANAILEARKPYVDPKQEQNNELFRAQEKAQQERIELSKKQYQESCEHIVGCNPLSDSKHPSNLTSIIWHRFDNGEDIGLCTNCQRVFRASDPDYREWRNKKSYNKQSMAGQRPVYQVAQF